MAFALVQGPTSSVESLTQAIVTINGVSAGNQLVIAARWYHATATISSITISGESNATVHGSPTKNASLNNATGQIASLANVTSGGNKTITCTFSADLSSAGGITVMEVSGGDTAAFFDVEAGSTGNSTNPTTSLTTSNANEMIVAVQSNGSADATAGSGYTLIALPNTFWFDEAEYNLDAGVAGSKTVDFAAGSAQWMVKAAAFKASGGGGGGGVTYSQLERGLRGVTRGVVTGGAGGIS